MKTLIYALSTLAVVGVAPLSAQAADLDGYNGGYVERGPVVEGPPVRPYYDEGPVVTYYGGPRYYRPDPYWAGYYPYGYGYWGGRPYWRSYYRGGWRGGGYWGRGGGWRGGHWGGGGHRGWR